MVGNFMKYASADAGGKNPGDIPVDSNELIALCAPRLTFISYGIPAKGDARWLDHQGSFMATVDASRVFTLLGAKGLEVEGDYHSAKMPPVNQGLLGGQLAWRQHDGGHTDAPNMKYFIEWADKFIGHKPPRLVKSRFDRYRAGYRSHPQPVLFSTYQGPYTDARSRSRPDL